MTEEFDFDDAVMKYIRVSGETINLHTDMIVGILKILRCVSDESRDNSQNTKRVNTLIAELEKQIELNYNKTDGDDYFI